MSTTEHSFFYYLAGVYLTVCVEATGNELDDFSIDKVVVSGTEIEFDLDELDAILLPENRRNNYSRVSIWQDIQSKLSDKYEELLRDRKETIAEAKADQRRDES